MAKKGAEGRSDFFANALGVVVGVLALGYCASESDDTPQGTCASARAKYDKALNAAINNAVTEGTEAQIKLEEALNSSSEFTHLAQYLDADTKEDGVMRFLYPGSGGHIAPIYMAAKLMDEGKAPAVEFVYTEIDECKRLELIQNLLNLPDYDSNFTFDPQETTYDLGGLTCEEIQYHFVLKYKEGQKITIRFCLNCSGEQYYRQNDFNQSDVHVLHDSLGYDPGELLFLVTEYFRSQHAVSGSAAPTIVMEDTTRYNIKPGGKEYSDSARRAFDLELLGVVHRGEEPYGHRNRELTTVDQLSNAQACRLLMKRKVDWKTIEPWLGQQGAPEQYRDIHTEKGIPYYNNGAVLKPHPKILQLDPRLTNLLIDIGVAANNSEIYSKGTKGEDLFRSRVDYPIYKEDAPLLFSPSFLKDLFTDGDQIMQVVHSIDPKLAEGLAVRMVQILVKAKPSLISEYIDTYYPSNREKGLQEVLSFFDSLVFYMPSAKNELEESLSFVRHYIETRPDDCDPANIWREDLVCDENKRNEVFESLYAYGSKLFDEL